MDLRRAGDLFVRNGLGHGILLRRLSRLYYLACSDPDNRYDFVEERGCELSTLELADGFLFAAHTVR